VRGSAHWTRPSSNPKFMRQLGRPRRALVEGQTAELGRFHRALGARRQGSSPILACNVFRSTAGAVSLVVELGLNSPAAPSSSCAFQTVTWSLGRMDVIQLRQLGQCLLALDGSQAHPRHTWIQTTTPLFTVIGSREAAPMSEDATKYRTRSEIAQLDEVEGRLDDCCKRPSRHGDGGGDCHPSGC
jgi:hypothetical protein